MGLGLQSGMCICCPESAETLHDDMREIVLKQFNYMRIKGINLVQDADDLVNLYLKIAKKFPE